MCIEVNPTTINNNVVDVRSMFIVSKQVCVFIYVYISLTYVNMYMFVCMLTLLESIGNGRDFISLSCCFCCSRCRCHFRFFLHFQCNRLQKQYVCKYCHHTITLTTLPSTLLSSSSLQYTQTLTHNKNSNNNNIDTNKNIITSVFMPLSLVMHHHHLRGCLDIISSTQYNKIVKSEK